jgi:predicted nucleic-acid-binding Zn-ribbon protein
MEKQEKCPHCGGTEFVTAKQTISIRMIFTPIFYSHIQKLPYYIDNTLYL